MYVYIYIYIYICIHVHIGEHAYAYTNSRALDTPHKYSQKDLSPQQTPYISAHKLYIRVCMETYKHDIIHTCICMHVQT